MEVDKRVLTETVGFVSVIPDQLDQFSGWAIWQ